MYAHVTNNDPLRVGVHFLQLVADSGGITLKVTVDCGTETGQMEPTNSHNNMLVSCLKKPRRICTIQNQLTIKKGAWKNDSQILVDDSRFGREVVGRESSLQFLKKHRESSH
jgi:hypothetical protein